MKSPREIIDDFCDDYFAGILPIDQDGKVVEKLQEDQAYLVQVNTNVKNFLRKLREYRDEKQKIKREELAKPILLELEEIRMLGLFVFTNDSIKLLKLELEKCKADNRQLAEELLWYQRSEKQSAQGVSPNAE